MDIKLESLIEKIKKDGIQEAKKTSQGIIEQANLEASRIITEARSEAKAITKQAQAEAQKLKDNTESSLKQAARDLVLVLKEELVRLFNCALKQEISENLNPKFMSQLIAKIVDKWTAKKEASLEITVSKKDEAELEKLLFSRLKGQAKERIEIKVGEGIDKGFSIRIKGEDLHYDFTDEAIMDSLRQFLNPSISKMLEK